MTKHSAPAVAVHAEAVGEMEPVLLHRCRGRRAHYDWRATATVGRFLCRGCGISGQCGACAELAEQPIAPGVVPALCALHGSLLEIGISDVALAVNFPAPVISHQHRSPARRTQLTLLPSMEVQPGKEDAERLRKSDASTQEVM